MIGRVVFTIGGSPAVATLDDFGVWSVAVDHPPGNREPDEVLTQDFNLHHSMADYSPADGTPGYKLLRDAANEWGGRVEAPPVAPTKPDLLY